MAEAFPDPDQTHTPDSDTTDSVTSCPVCTEFYTDPRLLNCGHHFCLSCLKKIAETHPNGHMTCPSCRHVTDESPETLSKLRMNEFQVKAADYVATTYSQCERPCEFCGKNFAELLSCYECRINFCVQCREDHQIMEEIDKHSVFPATCHQFCAIHPERFIQYKCLDCDKTGCILCSKDHKSHDVQSIKELAKNVTERLTNDVLDVVNVDTDAKVLASIENCIRDLKDSKDEFKDLNREIKRQVKSLLEKLENEEQKTLETIDGNIKELEVLQWEAKQFIATKQDLLIYIRKLTKESSDAELLAREKCYPKYATSEFIDTIGCPIIQKPVFDKLKNFNRYVDELIEANVCPSVTKPMHFKQLKDLKFISDIADIGKCGSAIHYISSLDSLAVYSHEDKLLTLVDTYGMEKQQTKVKSDIKRNGMQGLGYDHVRKLFLLPTVTGDIFNISLTGEEGKIKVIDERLHGISYSEEDLYVTSSAGGDYKGTKSVFIVNPNTGDILSTFKPTCTFRSPLNVLCGYEIALGEIVPVIYVSEHTGDQIKVVNFCGKVLHVIDAKSRPERMALDGEGNLLVCLYSNKSVVSFTKSVDENFKSSTLLGQTDLSALTPDSLVCDIKRGRLFVITNQGSIKCFG